MYKNEERIPCPECKGKGFVYGSYDANTDGRNYFILGACPICSGEGTITKEKKKDKKNTILSVKINDEKGKLDIKVS